MKIIKDIYHLSRHLILSKTAISTYVIFSGNITSAFLAFLFTVILVRKLSFADFGYFSALFSLVLLVSDLADIGIGSSLSAFLPPLEKTKEIMYKFLKSAFLLQFGIVSVITLILIIFSSQLSPFLFHTELLTGLLNITALCIFCTVIANFSLYALSARQKFFHAAFLSFYSSFARLLVLLFLILFSSVNLNNVVVFQFFGLFTYSIIAIIFLNPSFIKAKIDTAQMKNLISFTYLLGLARGLTALASRLDVLMIVALRGPTEAGIYAIAARIVQIFPLLSGSFATVVAPKLSSFKEHGEVKKFILKVIFFTSILIL